jgi:hypothetical protein
MRFGFDTMKGGERMGARKRGQAGGVKMTDHELFRPCSASSSRKVRLLALRTRACEHFRVSFHRLCLCLLAFSLAACSSYDSRWRHPHFAAGGKDKFEGSYAGTWSSKSYPGTGGKLWCIVTKKSGKEYLAEFKATWHGVFSSEHAVVLKKRTDGTFSGETEIQMWIGSGSYRCAGTMNGSALTASYDATYDRGAFTLSRPLNSAPWIHDPPVPVAFPTDSSQTRRLTPRPRPR